MALPEFATPTDLLNRYDRRRILELLSDDGEPAEMGDLVDNPLLRTLIQDASVEILSACQVSKRYTEEDFEVFLNIAAPHPAQALVKRLCCDLTYGLLLLRRGYDAAAVTTSAPLFAEAKRQLQLLREGERLFPNLPHSEAGLPQVRSFDGSPRPHPLSAETRFLGIRPLTTY